MSQNYQTHEETGKCNPYLEKGHLMDNSLEITQMLKLKGKNFKQEFNNTQKDIKDNILITNKQIRNGKEMRQL